MPLRRSWNAGAWKWTSLQRQIFANDPAELLAVSARANGPNTTPDSTNGYPTYQPCIYIAKYLTVAVKYQLPITVGERKAALHACPGPGRRPR
ncbi:MAG TPA: hypothetical protein VEF72_19085 [Mycobacterium sp.]|nr:hypothetical protein [Mycobacterium sp.]